jgi:hypothetical protein
MRTARVKRQLSRARRELRRRDAAQAPSPPYGPGAPPIDGV